ncbi:Hypothetical predicted protein [Cloeon dipterum]|uniref:SH3 domain-containing protein n=1 Tax=Cloeon dipterum TaxID=197152 RepID=A0A8S1C3E4_9INSE|nr:Hypothetical predicted protein [Cloeon dipterum]
MPSDFGSRRKMKLCVILTAAWLLMFLLLLYVTGPLLEVPIEKNEKLEQNLRVISIRLSHAFRQLEKLRRQNEELKKMIKVDFSSQNKTIRTLLEREKAMNEGSAIKACNPVPPRIEYEQTRRMIHSAVRDMWSYLETRFKSILDTHESENKSFLEEVKSLLVGSAGRIQFILKFLDSLPSVDGHAGWRQSEARYLSTIIQNRIKLLQNPPNCAATKLLMCQVSSDCNRLACRLERVTACLAEAYRMLRTLVIDDNAWNTNFLPLSQVCSDIQNKEEYVGVPWPGSPHDMRIDLSQDQDVLSWKVVPYDFSQHLNRLRGDPLLWWRGQLFSYLMRPMPTMNNLYHRVKERIKFFRNPIIGICVDDEGLLDDLISAVEHRYSQLEIKDISLQRRIFVSSNNWDIPRKIKKTYPHIDIMYVSEELMIEVGAEEFAEDRFEFQKDILDVHFLQNTEFIISASQSNKLCHIALAMKMNHTDAQMVSLGNISASDHKRYLDYMCIIKHVAQNEEEIELNIGDSVINVEKLPNGYSKGVNKVSRRAGLFPSYKVAGLTRYKKFYDFKGSVSTTKITTKAEQTTEEVYEYED